MRNSLRSRDRKTRGCLDSLGQTPPNPLLAGAALYLDTPVQPYTYMVGSMSRVKKFCSRKGPKGGPRTTCRRVKNINERDSLCERESILFKRTSEEAGPHLPRVGGLIFLRTLMGRRVRSRKLNRVFWCILDTCGNKKTRRNREGRTISKSAIGCQFPGTHPYCW